MIPVSPGREGWFLTVFVVQLIAWLILLIVLNTEKGWWLSIVGIGQGLSALVILTTATTVVTVEGGSMLAEQFLKRREERGEERGKAAARAEARKALAEWWDNLPEEVKKLVKTKPEIPD